MTRDGCPSGSLFVAFRGGTTDGNRYIPQAVAQGAHAIVTDSAAGFRAASLSVRCRDRSGSRPARAGCACRKFLCPSRSRSLNSAASPERMARRQPHFCWRRCCAIRGARRYLPAPSSTTRRAESFPRPIPLPSRATCWSCFAKAWRRRDRGGDGSILPCPRSAASCRSAF